jgi:hypothetical protein
VIMEYLQTGRNVPRKELFPKGSVMRSMGNAGTFRDLLYGVLRQIAERSPELAITIAKDALAEARSLSEANQILGLAEEISLTAVREAAIAAIARLAGEKKGFELPIAVQFMVKNNAEQLVPLLADVLEKKPYSLDIQSYLGALWSFPDEVRLEYSRKLIGSEAIRAVMRKYPSSWIWLDARDAEFRAAIVEDFKAPNTDEIRMYLVRALGKYASNGTLSEGSSRIDLNSIASGGPGSKEQAIARIKLLDDLEPYCDTPLLKQHHTQSRAALAAFVQQP